MKSMVVFFALASVACASWAPAVVAPYAHSVAVAPVVVAAPSAVSHQSRVDVRTSPAIVSTAYSVPAYGYAAPAYGYASLGYAGHGHYLHKRSLGHYAYAAPALVAAPSAVSHQSRVDVISSPAVVSHAVAAPVLARAAPVVAVAPAAPVVAVAPAAVSHQSRVDVRTSPAVVAHAAVAPINYAAGYYAGYNGYNGYNGYKAYSAPLVHAW